MILSLLLATALTLTPVTETTYRQTVAAKNGKVVVVDFWATWCGPCRQELPKLVSLQKRLGFQLVTVSVDEVEQRQQAAKFLQDAGVSGGAYIKQTDSDERFIGAIDPKWSGAVPALFIYDRTGKLVRTFVGEADFQAVEAALRKL